MTVSRSFRQHFYDELDFTNIEDESWMQEALCSGLTDFFYPHSDDRESAKNAIALCNRCPVRVQCLSYAVYHREEFGIWGGAAASVRMALWRYMDKNNIHSFDRKFIERS